MEAGDEITSRMLHKRSPSTVISAASTKKFKSMNGSVMGDDDMEM